jgi:hypothetical protein
MDNKEEIKVELTAEELDELMKDLPRILKELEREVNQKTDFISEKPESCFKP